ncbi:MAG: hypothetical protein D6732_03290 [Methanobacteriota archaeon]|nr:MAG: hypothetical protein D6732_03290 [Euryarchaeota archaeon]
MSSILPQGESVRKAVKWVSEQLEEHPDKSLMDLVNDASIRFDLDPQEQQFLVNFFRESRKSKDSE